MLLYVVAILKTQRILHGRAKIRNFSSRVEKHFMSERSITVAAVLCPEDPGRLFKYAIIITKYCLNPAMAQSGENIAAFNVLLLLWVKMKSKNWPALNVWA